MITASAREKSRKSLLASCFRFWKGKIANRRDSIEPTCSTLCLYAMYRTRTVTNARIPTPQVQRARETDPVAVSELDNGIRLMNVWGPVVSELLACKPVSCGRV